MKDDLEFGACDRQVPYIVGTTEPSIIQNVLSSS
jgi:hypothetical protein